VTSRTSSLEPLLTLIARWSVPFYCAVPQGDRAQSFGLLQPYYDGHSVIASSLAITIPSLVITDLSLDGLQGPMGSRFYFPED